jgi:hypothetical protein
MLGHTHSETGGRFATVERETAVGGDGPSHRRF